MSSSDPFDQQLELIEKHIFRVPEGVVNAAVFVNDTLKLSYASAKSLFEDKATPELAFEIYDRLVERMESSQ